MQSQLFRLRETACKSPIRLRNFVTHRNVKRVSMGWVTSSVPLCTPLEGHVTLSGPRFTSSSLSNHWHRFISTSTSRLAPKAKGKGKTEEKVQGEKGSDQVFNVFVDKPDHRILPDEFYPKWLFNLASPTKSYGELSLMFVYGQVSLDILLYVCVAPSLCCIKTPTR